MPSPDRTLRERIQATIEDHRDDPAKAAIAVCALLDWTISLAGNGWFDDDEVMQDELQNGSEPPHA